jgi:hypothetical protein
MQQMEDLFSDVVGLKRDGGQEPNKEVAINTILERVRDILGVRQPVALRKHFLALRTFSDGER